MANSISTKRSATFQLRIVERRALLLVVDFVVALAAMLIALIYWGSTMRFFTVQQFIESIVPVWFYFLPLIWILLLLELYDLHIANNWKRTYQGVLIAALIGLGFYLVFYIVSVEPGRNFLPRLSVAIFLVLASIMTLAWRAIYIKVFTAPQFMRKVLLVGAGITGQIMIQIVNLPPVKPFNLIGIIDDDPNKQNTVLEGYPVLGTCQEMLTIIEKEKVTDLIVAISGQMNGNMFQTLLDAQEKGIEITRMQVAYEELLGRVPVRWLEADWILRSFVDEARSRGFYSLWKRIIDLIGGVIGCMFFFLLLPFIALILWLDDGRPIFYSQMRSGKGGQPYSLLKFRTMKRDAEADGKPRWASENDERTTRIGKIMRKTHLDELPQFLSVLRGEMSLVGPRAERPELVEMFQKHVPFYRARLLVKPGLTGWAQVNQNYAASIDETITKLEYDLYYIKHRNIFLDISILLRTPATILGFRGR